MKGLKFQTFYHDCRSKTVLIEATTVVILILSQPQTKSVAHQSTGSRSRFVLLGLTALMFTIIKLPAFWCSVFHLKDMPLSAMAQPPPLSASPTKSNCWKHGKALCVQQCRFPKASFAAIQPCYAVKHMQCIVVKHTKSPKGPCHTNKMCFLITNTRTHHLLSHYKQQDAQLYWQVFKAIL